MRRVFATILISGFLFTAAPSLWDDGPRHDFNPIHFIIKFVRHLIAAPTDGGDNLGPPKP